MGKGCDKKGERYLFLSDPENGRMWQLNYLYGTVRSSSLLIGCTKTTITNALLFNSSIWLFKYSSLTSCRSPGIFVINKMTTFVLPLMSVFFSADIIEFIFSITGLILGRSIVGRDLVDFRNCFNWRFRLLRLLLVNDKLKTASSTTSRSLYSKIFARLVLRSTWNRIWNK